MIYIVVDGSWTPWTSFSTCTVTCGGGESKRTRNCTSPLPQHGGKNCSGVNNETKICNIDHCPGDY